MKSYKAFFLLSFAAILFSCLPAFAEENPNIMGCCQFKGTNAETVYQNLIQKECDLLPSRQFSANFHVNATNDGCEPTELENVGTLAPKTTPSEPIATPLLSVLIPDLTLKPSTCNETTCSSPWLGDYIAGLYKYGVAAVSILAAIALMIAGIIWISSAGNSEQIGQAKKWISGSLMALLLVYSPYVLLKLINGSLLQLNPIEIDYISSEILDTGDPLVGSLPSDGRTAGSNPLADGAIPVLVDLPEAYSSGPLSMLIATAQAAGKSKCTLTFHLNNTGNNLRNDWMADNKVPRVFCPHSGGPGVIAEIARDIDRKNMVTYRLGGKGGPPDYVDGIRGGPHQCNQDEACTEQIAAKKAEKDKNNCKFCCPEGQACIDCSGFVNHVLSCAGMPIIDNAAAVMMDCGEKISNITYDAHSVSVNGQELIPGDLLASGKHVIMYIGDGQTAESTPNEDDSGRRPGQAVRVGPYREKKWPAVVRISDFDTKNGCIETNKWGCDKRKDRCCGTHDFCRKHPDGWKCETQPGNCIALHDWDCESDSDCCSGICKKEKTGREIRGVCRPS